MNKINDTLMHKMIALYCDNIKNKKVGMASMVSKKISKPTK